MQLILTVVLMLMAFIGGVYTSDNSTLMDCMRVGTSRLNGSTITCDAPRPPKPIAGQTVQPEPGVKDATTKMMDFMLRRIEDMDKADKTRRSEPQQPTVIQVMPQQTQLPAPTSQKIVVPQNETSVQVQSGNPVKMDKPKVIDTEESEGPIKN